MIDFFGQDDTLADVAASATTAVDIPPDTPVGATLIAHIVSATTTAHTGPAGDTWELLGTSAQGQLLTSVWRRIATGTEAASYTWGHGNTRAAGRIAAYPGVLDVAAIEPAGTTDAGDTIATTAVAVPAGGWLLLLAACRRGSPSVPQVWTTTDPLDVKRGEVSGATGSSNQVSCALLDSGRPLAADLAAVRTVNAAEAWGSSVVWALALTPVPSLGVIMADQRAVTLGKIVRAATTSSPAWPTTTVTELDPATGDEAGGTAVEVIGTGLSGTTAVLFAGVPATAVVVVSDVLVTCVSPAGAGEVDVVVVGPGGPITEADGFTYTGE